MAKIKDKNIYPLDVKIVGDEYFIGTDSDGKTRNYPISELKDYLNGDSPIVVDGGGYENEDGTFTWVMYAEDIDGTNMSAIKLETSNFIGYGFNKTVKTPSDDPLEYIWIPLTFEKGRDGIDGANGIDGLDGETGIQGPIGLNGEYTYFHIAYADDENGGGFSQHPFDKKFIGTYSDYTIADSNMPSDYTWIEVKGLDGTIGIPGYNAEDGLTYYLHIAYATSSDGSTGFDIVESQDKTFIGTLVDLIEADSLIPTDYSWSRILDPTAGVDDGNGTFTWIKYTLVPDGTSPLVDSEFEMRYMGFAYRKTTPVESEDYRDYEWHLIYREDLFVEQNNKIRTIKIPEAELISLDDVGFANWIESNVVSVEEDEIVVLEVLGDIEVVIPIIDDSLTLDLYNGTPTINSIPLNWDNNGDTAIVGYDLFYSQITGTTFSDVKELSLVSSDTLTALNSGEKFKIWIEGYDTKGNRKISNKISVETLVDYTALTPELNVESVTDTTIKTNWSIEASFSADRYELYVDAVKVYDGANLNYTATGLTQSTSYSFQIQAFNGATASNLTTKSFSTIATVTPSLTPPVIAFVKNTDTSIQISISTPILESDRILGFQIDYRILGTSTWITRVINKLDLYPIKGLLEGTTYEIRVRSFNDDVISLDSNVLVASTAIGENAGVSLFLRTVRLGGEENYNGELTIFNGKPNTVVTLDLSLTVDYLGSQVNGSIEFKNAISGLTGNTSLVSYNTKRISITLDANGFYNNIYETRSLLSEFGIEHRVTASLVTSLNGIDPLNSSSSQLFVSSIIQY